MFRPHPKLVADFDYLPAQFFQTAGIVASSEMVCRSVLVWTAIIYGEICSFH